MVACRVPGPLCAFAYPGTIDDGTSARNATPPPTPLGTEAGATMPPPQPAAAPAGAAASAASATPASTPVATTMVTAVDLDTRTLAATAYGEGSSKDGFDAMAAIANVLVRPQKARSHASALAFIKADKAFAYAAQDGNERYARLMAATVDDLNQDAGMAAAVAAAANALAKEPLDDAHGAYCWDGADIKTNDANPAKVLGGIHFTDPQHKRNIKDKELPGATWWVDAKESVGLWVGPALKLKMGSA